MKNERTEIRMTTAAGKTGIPERSTHKGGVTTSNLWMTPELCYVGTDSKQKQASQLVASTVPGTREVCPELRRKLNYSGNVIISFFVSCKLDILK